MGYAHGERPKVETGTTGRNTICTPELIEEVCEVLADGNTIKTTCQYVGIGESTYYAWLEKAKDELDRVDGEVDDVDESKRPYVNFYLKTSKARVSGEVESVKQIRKAGKKDWRAAAWYLEHSHTEKWGKGTKEFNLNVKDERSERVKDLSEEFDDLSNEELIAVIKEACEDSQSGEG